MSQYREIFHRTELCLGVPPLTFVEKVMILSRLSPFEVFKDIQMEKEKKKQICLIIILLSDLNLSDLKSIVRLSLGCHIFIATIFLPATKW